MNPLTSTDLRNMLDQLATELVLLDPQDLAALEHWIEGLRALEVEPIRQRIADALITLAGHVRDTSAIYACATQVLDEVRTVLEVEHLEPEQAVGEPDAVRDEFLGRAADAVADLAGLIDRFAAGEPVVLDLRRGIHTLKGEAGALDLRAPARVLHALEDAFERRGDFDARTALMAVDWCGDCFEALRQAKPAAADPEPILRAIAGDTVIDTAGPLNSGQTAGGQAPVAVAKIRVDAARLDALYDAVGELVVVHAMLTGAPELLALRDRRLRALFATLERTTAVVRSLTTRLRLVPLSGLLQRTARIARETARQLGREVTVELEGEDLEVDRSVADHLAEPLLHIVRNAIDHGIELPAERLAAGKPACGILRLRAGAESGGFGITVSDDGRGIDRERILARAQRAGLIDASASVDDVQVEDLLFAPGFSTAEAVSEVSGRGVGLDAVRSAVNRLHGRVELTGRCGSGCTVTIRLPTTLSVIDGLAVEAAGQRLIIPIEAVACTQCLLHDGDEPQSTVRRLITVQGRQVALVGLAGALGFTDAQRPVRRPMAIIVESGGIRLALRVDAVIGRQHVVLKGLGRGLPPPPGISGAAIASDGRPVLVVDTIGLFRLLLGEAALRHAS